ncbi:hypothetical protein F511_42713 [Dorcoceras hygrometricum]|uniref:Uncharacterized protein n=1 Tax=Dorcoceras hygrometricum TaxID=472368 RepID=A0A2Z7A6L0_9LAMI|nr:hypothetical protein F511_42713 [Dorcoceras hygrometricum]
MGLRFPIPRFITAICKYLNASPSQLAPNSYSFLLSLGILLSFFDIPLTTYVLMQLIHVKRLGPRKFYLSHKADRMGKTEMLKALKGRPKEGSLGAVAPPSLNKGKNSLVVSPSRFAVMGLLCNMVPDRDLDLVRDAPDIEVLVSFAIRFEETMVWSGEVINRLTRDRREVTSSRQSLDEVLEHHTELAKQLEELEAMRAEERRATEVRREVLEVEKEALEAEKEALAVEKEALVAELVDTKARVEGEIEHLKGEAENPWGLGKEEFLKSSEFDDLCAQKSLAYFKCGFEGCLAQLRANGYTEEEHPAHSSALLGP